MIFFLKVVGAILQMSYMFKVEEVDFALFKFIIQTFGLKKAGLTLK